MKTSNRRPMTAVALSAAGALLAACAGQPQQGTGWNDAWTYTPPSEIGQQPATRTAAAETPTEPKQYADANHDGKITQEEARVDPALVASFDQYDRNHDGTLDSAEFAQLVADSRERHPRSENGAEFARMEVGMNEIGSYDRPKHFWRPDRAHHYGRDPNLSPWY